MKTRVRYTPLGCYDLCHPHNKSESYDFFFDENDKDNKTVVFTYDEEGAPEIKCHNRLPGDILRDLQHYESKKYWISSSHNGIQEKPHDEKIEMAFELAKANEKDDAAALLPVMEQRLTNAQEALERIREATQ